MELWQVLFVIAFLIAVVIIIYFNFWNILHIKRTSKEANKIIEEQKNSSNKKNYRSFKLIKKIFGDLTNFEQNLYKKNSSVGLILGARGSGKSALGMRIAENFETKTDKKLYAIGFIQKDLPKFIKSIEDPDQIPNSSFVLIDEGGIFFSSRDSMKDANKLVSKLILVARHKDLSVLFITQNSSNIDINIIRQSDYLMLKPSSLLQLDFERSKIKDIYEEAKEDFDTFKNESGVMYIYSNEFKGFVSNELASFWTMKISKSMGSRDIAKKTNKFIN